MIKIAFFGAAGDVTGSAHLITLWDDYRILLDCGMFQGNEDESDKMNRHWGFDPSLVDCVVLSHAHIDHCGRLPRLVKDGFKGNIYSTPATRSLALIMLLDSAKIQQADYEFEQKWAKKKDKKIQFHEALYDTADVYETIAQIISVGYNRKHYIHPHVQIEFRDAGHILGSASISLSIKLPDGSIKKIGFTGDIGRPDRPILKDPVKMDHMDFVISESTYGNKKHVSKSSEYEKFLQIIKNTCVEKKGKLLIPAFSLGRTQEIVYMLNKMSHEGKLPQIPVYVDSPLSVNATRIFRMHPECYDNETKDFITFDSDPFGFNGLTYITDVNQSKALNTSSEACIIISSSGMATAGRIRHHIFNNIESQQNTILIVGYCSPGTLGSILKEGIDVLKMYGEQKIVRAEVEVMDSFSAHGDQEEMFEFISNQINSVEKLFLVHGNDENRTAFKNYLGEKGFQNILMPIFGEEFDLF